MIERRCTVTVAIVTLVWVVMAHCAVPGASRVVPDSSTPGGLFSPVWLQTDEQIRIGGGSEAEAEAGETATDLSVAADETLNTESDTDDTAAGSLVTETDTTTDTDTETVLDTESESQSQSESESESEMEMDADEEDFDLDADEQLDAQLDAEAQYTLQQYAEQQGAVEEALESLSNEAALADVERDMTKELARVGSKTNTKGKTGKNKNKSGGKRSRKALSTGLKMSQLNLRDEKGEGAKINLAQGRSRYSLGVNAGGVFSIDMESRTLLSVSGKSGVARMRGDLTVWNTLSADSLTLNQVPQWKLVREDTFEKFVPLPKRPTVVGTPKTAVKADDLDTAPKPPPSKANPSPQSSNGPSAANAKAKAVALAKAAAVESAAAKALAKKARGWLYDDVIKCNGFSMLSPKPGRTVSTKYVGLPKHTHIRITATVHFIDDWQGETAWMKLNNFMVWTESHDQKNTAGKFSICGSDLYPESRFSAPIDLTWPHTAKNLNLALGSNLDEGSDARFAVSNVAIYTRDTTRKKKKSKKDKCKKKGKDGKCLSPAKPKTASKKTGKKK